MEAHRAESSRDVPQELGEIPETIDQSGSLLAGYGLASSAPCKRLVRFDPAGWGVVDCGRIGMGAGLSDASGQNDRPLRFGGEHRPYCASAGDQAGRVHGPVLPCGQPPWRKHYRRSRDHRARHARWSHAAAGRPENVVHQPLHLSQASPRFEQGLCAHR